MEAGISASPENTSQVPELLQNTLRDIGIPPRPAILERINEEMRKDDPNFRQLGLVISSDVGLAAGLIAMANSPFFGYKGRVRSVNEALMMLGLSTASQAIAGLILRQIFPAIPSLVRFWDASASIARLSGWLAQRATGGTRLRADDAYTFGLFRDCGIAIMMRRYNNYAGTLSQANQEKSLSFTAVEETFYPTNHAVVGCLLAQSWWLPEEVCLAIRHHHEYPLMQDKGKSSRLPATSLAMIATSQLAEHLFQFHTGMSHTQEWAKASALCLEWLGISDENLPQLYEDSRTVLATKDW